MGLPLLNITSQQERGVTLVSAEGELDIQTSEQLHETVGEAIETGPVVVDLLGVPFMDSSGISVLIRARRSEQRLALVLEEGGPVERALAVTGLAEFFAVFRDPQQALDSLAQ